MERDERGEELILVDADDNPVGFETKLGAHEGGGKLHRAFSVFVFGRDGKMLLQRRAEKKYHFGGLWSNACCGHPKRGENLSDAARVRLEEEFGFTAEVEEVFSFVYQATDANSGLTEHEYDHVFYATFGGEPRPDPDEIGAWKWVDPAQLSDDLQSNPHEYTPWFVISAPLVIETPPNLK